MFTARKRYDAVIFDLFGTLVDNVTDAFYYASLGKTAAVLGIEPAAFIACWTGEDFRGKRRCGVLPGVAAQMEYACAQLGITASTEILQKAAAIQRFDFGYNSLAPRPGTLETLAQIKEAGYALGLISDCSWEVPDVWAETPFAGIFDVTIFSCEAGARKPDPRLFQLACERLQVAPQRCLYVGDGSGRELTGAQQAGMTPILLCAPHEREMVMQEADPREWRGPVIEGIEGVWEYI